jgi:hypothetical protein
MMTLEVERTEERLAVSKLRTPANPMAVAATMTRASNVENRRLVEAIAIPARSS